MGTLTQLQGEGTCPSTGVCPCRWPGVTAEGFDGFFCFPRTDELVSVKDMFLSAGFIWRFVRLCADSLLDALSSPDTFFVYTRTQRTRRVMKVSAASLASWHLHLQKRALAELPDYGLLSGHSCLCSSRSVGESLN